MTALWTSTEVERALSPLGRAAPFEATGVTFDSRAVARGDLFFALPGEGTVRTLSFLLEERAVVIGDLYFKSPTLRWEAGTYRFVFEHEQGRADLPIRLE